MTDLPPEAITWRFTVEDALLCCAECGENVTENGLTHDAACGQVRRLAEAIRQQATTVEAITERLRDHVVTIIHGYTPDGEPIYAAGAVNAAVQAKRELEFVYRGLAADSHGNRAIPGDDELASAMLKAALPHLRGAEVADMAEVIHAEHHPGNFVPSLDSCPEHTREQYEAIAAGRRYDASIGTEQPDTPAEPVGADAEPGELGSVHTDDQEA